MAKILSVDDRGENRYLLEVILGAAGYEVHSAENGVAALSKLEKDTYDLIISDILMPEMDGFQLCREVKHRQAFKHIPFIFYTATYTEEKDKEFALSLGAERFIIKPAEPERFLAAVQEVLKEYASGQLGQEDTQEESEEIYLAVYNQRLIHKLEKKILDLEKTTQELEKALQAQKAAMEERELAEQALLASEARYRLITAHMGDVVWLLQRGAEHFTYVSPSVEKLSGFSLDEVMASPIQAFLKPEAAARLVEDIASHIQALEAGDERARHWVTETDQLRKDGSFLPVESVIELIANPQGQVTSILGVSRDISLRRQALQALHESEAKYRDLFTRATEGIFQTTLEGRLLEANPALARILGYPTPEALMADLPYLSQCLVHPEARQPGIDRILGEGAIANYEVEARDRDGGLKWLSVSAHAVKNEAGDVQHLEGMILDITRQKANEREIRALNANLEQRVQERTLQFEASNRELEAFATSVSHDLKAPLRSIRGFGEALQEDFGPLLPPEGMDHLQRVISEARRMESQIESLLRLAQVGQQELILEEVDISDMAHALSRLLSQREPNREVHWDIEPQILIHADPILMRVLLENILSNAWKFTSKVSPARIRICAEPSEEGWSRFAVEDNGAGFDPALTNRLFAPFQRLHSQKEFPGTGVGLAIVRRIANRHGARISARSEPDRGTTLSFSFPACGNGPTEQPSCIPSA